MAGAVLNALNYRLDGRTIAFIFQHGGAKLLITDAEFSDTVDVAVGLLPRPIPIVDIVGPDDHRDEHRMMARRAVGPQSRVR